MRAALAEGEVVVGGAGDIEAVRGVENRLVAVARGRPSRPGKCVGRPARCRGWRCAGNGGRERTSAGTPRRRPVSGTGRGAAAPAGPDGRSGRAWCGKWRAGWSRCPPRPAAGSSCRSPGRTVALRRTAADRRAGSSPPVPLRRSASSRPYAKTSSAAGLRKGRSRWRSLASVPSRTAPSSALRAAMAAPRSLLAPDTRRTGWPGAAGWWRWFMRKVLSSGRPDSSTRSGGPARCGISFESVRVANGNGRTGADTTRRRTAGNGERRGENTT